MGSMQNELNLLTFPYVFIIPVQFNYSLLKINDKIEICGEYQNNKTKIDARCKHCGYEWKVVAASLLNGHGCPKCARKNRNIRK